MYDKGSESKRLDYRKSYNAGAARELAFIGYLVTLFMSVAKADMTIDRREIEVIKAFFRQNFRFSNDDYSIIDKLIKKAAATSTDLENLCIEVKKYFKYPELLMLLRMVYNVALSDKQLNKQESQRIEEIVTFLGITPDDHYRIKQEFLPTADYYSKLGVDGSASDTEVKKAYRNLVKKYHPDKVSHLGEEFIEIAKKKFQSIQEAYEKIRMDRGF
jgi:DnaJ like chaperone protein